MLNFLGFKIAPPLNLVLYFRRRPLRRKVTIPFVNPILTLSLRLARKISVRNEGGVVKTIGGNAIPAANAEVRVVVVVEIDEEVRVDRPEVEELGNQLTRESLRRSIRVDLLRQRFPAPHSMWARLNSCLRFNPSFWRILPLRSKSQLSNLRNPLDQSDHSPKWSP